MPDAATWIGKNNRESQTVPVLWFRQCLQQLKLLRKYKGSLLPTRRAVAAQGDPSALWNLLAEELIPAKDGFDRDATALLLLHIASTPASTEVSYAAVADALTSWDGASSEARCRRSWSGSCPRRCCSPISGR